MTDSVTTSPSHTWGPQVSARTVRYGGHSAGWVVPDTETLLADIDSALAAGPYNAFAASSSSSSLTVTIDTGEAAVGGGLLARDTTTDVDLSANTADQTVYVGWSVSTNDQVLIGLSGAFNAADPRIPLWTFSTDGSGVTSTTDNRELGERIETQNARYETADGSGPAVDNASSAATAAALEERSLATVARDARSVTLPAAQIPDGDHARTFLQISGAAKLLEQTHMTDGFTSPAGLQVAVYSGAGTQLYADESRRSAGTPDAPVSTWDVTYLEFRLENNTGDEIIASAQFQLLIE